MHEQSMKKRLFRFFGAFSLISVVTVAAAACIVSYRHVMEMAVTTSEQIVEKTADEVDNLLEDMISMSRIISRSAGVQSVMRTEYPQYKAQFSDRFELDAYLSELNQYNSSIFAMYFFADNGMAAKSQYYSFINEKAMDNPYCQKALQSEHTIWLPPEQGSQFAVTTGETLLTTVTPVKELGSGEYRGIVVVELEAAKVSSFLNTRVSESGFLYIQDTYGRPIIGPADMTAAQLSERVRQNASYSWKDAIFHDLRIEQPVLQTGWKLVCTVPGRELAQNVLLIIKIVSLVSIGVMGIALLLAYRVAAYIVCPITKLDEKMRLVEQGDLNVHAVPERDDEIGALTNRFNMMLNTIHILMEHEVENQKKLRLTELKALQAQIKPHFLYNTLDSIIWMVRSGDKDGAVRMVMALTQFLKIGLSRGREVITLREELAHAGNYLIIQNIRYKGKFTHEIHLKEEIASCLIPKLVLQPLIENAIYHGMKPKRGSCHLKIWVRPMEKNIVIDVIDNGVGMTEEASAALNNTLRHGSGPRAESYGVVNVNERIRILFGEPYGVTFESRQGEGSCFRITLPMRWEEETE
ncbi:sensor histidine kinase [Agathobaculum sp. NSJ-28]|uniref:histidine kinase n=2 Tax=Agathobaculum TaxID=2048137 RepID=A0A923LW19_9FIRM|nr:MULTISPECIES: sensor histidine kinase [Agathobaculum]MBC5725451.1 sensor histidine kinase [Agathobaculum faecis]MCU6790230.1 sensor histidine kinase [Agathobaculum ammoniilyticum]SCJ55013.1 Probable sensor-like histidine kinase YehU [uncultured Butyricicoccus sp.]